MSFMKQKCPALAGLTDGKLNIFKFFVMLDKSEAM